MAKKFSVKGRMLTQAQYDVAVLRALAYLCGGSPHYSDDTDVRAIAARLYGWRPTLHRSFETVHASLQRLIASRRRVRGLCVHCDGTWYSLRPKPREGWFPEVDTVAIGAAPAAAAAASVHVVIRSSSFTGDPTLVAVLAAAPGRAQLRRLAHEDLQEMAQETISWTAAVRMAAEQDVAYDVVAVPLGSMDRQLCLGEGYAPREATAYRPHRRPRGGRR